MCRVIHSLYFIRVGTCKTLIHQKKGYVVRLSVELHEQCVLACACLRPNAIVSQMQALLLSSVTYYTVLQHDTWRCRTLLRSVLQNVTCLALQQQTQASK